MNTLTKNVILTPLNMLYKVSPRKTLELLFRIKQGYSLNLDCPKTFNEKLQWIKLYDRNPQMPYCCDKYEVRSFVEKQGCGEILNHLIWQGNAPEDIPFDILPEKFVIKVTHGSTFNVICTDKSKLNKEETVRNLKKWLKVKFLPCYGEWFYGKVKPRIIVEDFIESADDKQLRDYKVFCFNGVPKLIRVDMDRFTQHKADIFDVEWNHIPKAGMGFPLSGRVIERPVCLEKMLKYAEILSKPFHHARVDFYIVGSRIIFGEITFTNGAGFDRFSSYDFDLQMGQMLTLPIDEKDCKK